MATVVERLPIEPLYLWAGLTGLTGLAVLMSSTVSLLAGVGYFFHWLMILAGLSMILGMAWAVRHPDSTDVSTSGYQLGFLVVCAVVVVGASLQQILALA
ncbi:hypothetical protein [Halococcus hamelinensis]|uniref:Uncharacterized protein n=1 Tax=Halococcus hamelinensis 100A6 TaxID=1132509 RepID=M0M064_9EURY|nr:hypothetical protein [Halococcus hamelinensis]EMA37775.1 hypothetical protein C447_12405 [Halococcus hamelinensis 100A6]